MTVRPGAVDIVEGAFRVNPGVLEAQVGNCPHDGGDVPGAPKVNRATGPTQKAV